MKILIVDDYSTMRRIIRNLLSQIGHNDLWEAEDGANALGHLKAMKFDLVISDLNMEPMSGFDLRKEMLKEEKLRAIPFLLVTPESFAGNMSALKDAGVSDYIAKPFNAATLQTKINGVLPAKA